MKSLSLRRNFLWSFFGNTVYNLVQWLLLVALARLGDPQMVGQFALMLAITAPVYMTVGLNLRVVRATDVRRVWTHDQYYQLRLLLNAVSLVVTMLIGLALGFRGGVAFALLFLAMGKSVESTSLMLYGFFQLRERLDLVARSLMLRAGFGSGCFVVMLSVTGDLEPACLGLAVGWLFVWLVHDRVQERRLLATEPQAMSEDRVVGLATPGSVGSLARKALPLGIDAGIGSFATNVPRYAIQLSMGSAILGVFAPLAYAAQIVSMITGTLGDTVVGRLAKHVEHSNTKAFTRVLGMLVLFGLAVSLGAALVAWFLGGWAIGLVLGPEYVNQPVLVVLMLGAGAITLQRSLARGLQAAHLYSSVLLVDTVIMVSTVIYSAILVSMYGQVGAAATLGLGFLTGVALSIGLLFRMIVRMRSSTSQMATL